MTRNSWFLALVWPLTACSTDAAVPSLGGSPTGTGAASSNASPTALPPVPPTPGGVDWSLSFGGPEDDIISSISATPTDDLLIGGSFGASLTLGTAELVASGEQDAFVARIDSTGTPLWSRALGASEFASVSDVGFDAAGNVYFCGTFRGNVDLGGKQATSEAGNDLFAAKLDASGTPVWLVAFGTAGAESAEAFAVDALGNVTLLGRAVTEELAFADAGLLSTGNRSSGQLILLRLSSEGELLWGRTFGDGGVPTPSAITLSNDGTTLVAGTLDGGWEIAGEMLDGDAEGFAAGFDTEGQATWAQLSSTGAGDGKVSFNAIAESSTGFVYAGSLRGTASVGSTALNDVGAGDAIVAQLTAVGAPIWAKSFGGIGNESARAVAVSADGSLIVSGVYQGSPTLGATSLPAAARHGTLVFKLTSAGELVWASAVVTNSAKSGQGVATLSDGSAVVGGGFSGAVRAGNQQHNSRGKDDAYLFKLLP